MKFRCSCVHHSCKVDVEGKQGVKDGTPIGCLLGYSILAAWEEWIQNEDKALKTEDGILEDVYAAYGTGSGVLFGIPAKSSVKAVIGFVMKRMNED